MNNETVNSDPATVPCRICGNATTYTGTRLCNRCWELEGRIQRDPELAKKIFQAITGAGPKGWRLVANIKELEYGMRVRSLGHTGSWIIIRNNGSKAVAIKSVEVTHPSEWEVEVAL